MPRKDLWQSERRYRAMIEYASDIVYAIDNVGTFTYASHLIGTEQVGHEIDEVVGANFAEFIHTE